MIDYRYFTEQDEASYLKKILPVLLAESEKLINSNRFGDAPKWADALAKLPKLFPDSVELNNGIIRASSTAKLDDAITKQLEEQLMRLCPWRKGPYQIHDVLIDTEWRSDFKWQRLQDKISPLDDKVILDVGCGNGYHAFRMLGANAKLVVGIDPMLFYVYQFFALNHFFQSKKLAIFPLPLEALPQNLPCFDSVFSMGVLYHRRSPIDHLLHLKSLLKPGGELVLETLVVPDDYASDCLVPQDRYAKMRNVWFIPNTKLIIRWLERVGFSDVKLIDVSQTSVEEQRKTDWMRYESLADFLDPNDPNLSIEGYPAPFRAAFTAKR